MINKEQKTTFCNPVTKPEHYQLAGSEVIDIIHEVVDNANLEPFKSYCLGNIIKYILRAGKKGGMEDYKKAQVYLNWLIEAQTIVGYPVEKPDSDPKDSWLDYLNNCIDLEIYNSCGAGETEYRAGLYKVKEIIESIFDSIDA